MSNTGVEAEPPHVDKEKKHSIYRGAPFQIKTRGTINPVGGPGLRDPISTYNERRASSLAKKNWIYLSDWTENAVFP